MSSWVRYTPEDRVLDLANLNRSDYELCPLHGKVIRGQGTLFPGGGRHGRRIRLLSEFAATEDVPPICAG